MGPQDIVLSSDNAKDLVGELGKRISIAIRGSDVQLKFNRHDEEGVWL
jgi:hypothetical protein